MCLELENAHPDTVDAIDMVDSAFFTGDVFMNRHNIKEMREKLASWNRQLDSNEQLLSEIESEEQED